MLFCSIGTSGVTRKRRSVDQTTTDSIVNILPFTGLSTGGSCTSLLPSTCTAIALSTLHWELHANHDYYISVKATNVVGLYTIATSSAYTHDISPPTGGLVFDVGADEMSRVSIEQTCFRLSFKKDFLYKATIVYDQHISSIGVNF